MADQAKCSTCGESPAKLYQGTEFLTCGKPKCDARAHAAYLQQVEVLRNMLADMGIEIIHPITQTVCAAAAAGVSQVRAYHDLCRERGWTMMQLRKDASRVFYKEKE